MKCINDPGPIHPTEPDGARAREVVKGDDGYPVIEIVDGVRRQKTRPVVLTLRDVLVGLSTVPAYVGERKGMDAAVFLLETRQALKAWPEGPGPKLLENDQHAGFLRVLKEHDFGAGGDALVPYLLAVRDAKDAPAVVPVAEEQAATKPAA